jgi:hypothetical protein
MRRVGYAAVAALGLLGCSTGEGEGWVRSDRLFVAECWNGSFDLSPTFFGANPFRDSLSIRVQRGDDMSEVSDGLSVLVQDTGQVRESIGAPQRVGLPPGVRPPGFPIVADPDPPKVGLSLYLHNTCQAGNATLYAIDGSITFSSLFSGDPNETDASERLTEARFAARFADPRDQSVDGVFPAGRVSDVEGGFRFYFQRGQPAQPFP